jgi:L-rhamnose mutarotase
MSKAFAQVLDLKNDPKLIEDYVKYHENVWPEVLEALAKIGIVKMKIFLLGTHLFMYYEAPEGFNPARDFQTYTASNPKCQEWDLWMRTFQQKVAEAGPDDWWTPMKEVFDLQSQLSALRAQKE